MPARSRDSRTAGAALLVATVRDLDERDTIVQPDGQSVRALGTRKEHSTRLRRGHLDPERPGQLTAFGKHERRRAGKRDRGLSIETRALPASSSCRQSGRGPIRRN